MITTESLLSLILISSSDDGSGLLGSLVTHIFDSSARGIVIESFEHDRGRCRVL